MSLRSLCVRVLASVAIVTLTMTTPAEALELLPYDGTDPNSTGCAASGITEYSIPVRQGTLELRFSTGCQTAWSRFTCHSDGPCGSYNTYVQRLQDGYAQANGVEPPYTTPAGGILYTNQVYDGPGYSAYACYADLFQQWTCTGPFFF